MSGILDILKELGSIDDSTVEGIVDRKPKNDFEVVKILKEEKIVDVKKILDAKSLQTNTGVANLADYEITEENITVFGKDLCRKYLVLPLSIEEDSVAVAMDNPVNFRAIEDIRLKCRKRVNTYLADGDDILEYLNRIVGTEESIEELNKYSDTLEEEEDIDENDLENEPVVKFLDTLCVDSVNRDVSDIHIEPTEKDVIVRTRIDGTLREYSIIEKKLLKYVVNRIKYLCTLNTSEKRRPQDGRFSLAKEGYAVDLRVSIIPTVWGEKVVMRILNRRKTLMSRDELGLTVQENNTLARLISKPQGILLVCGPTGSGKSSTLYTLLSELNTVEKNCVTIEDPVEFTIKGINQIQVCEDINLTFAEGLRAILRQDPDIIMLGEIRDKETAEIAISAAITGHLVLSTIHTNDAVKAITRLQAIGIPSYQISSALIGVISQRLIRRTCTECYGTGEKDGHKCPVCDGAKYKGRKAVFEILEIDKDISSMIDSASSSYAIEEKAISKGMTLLKDSINREIARGVTDEDELVRVLGIQR